MAVTKSLSLPADTSPFRFPLANITGVREHTLQVIVKYHSYVARCVYT